MTSNRANAKGERARGTITKAKATSAEGTRQLRATSGQSSAKEAYTNPMAILGTKWLTGSTWCRSMPRKGMEDHNPLRTSREWPPLWGTKKQPTTVSDMKPESEETYVMNNLETHKYHQRRGPLQQQWGIKQQRNTGNDMKPDKEETSPGKPRRSRQPSSRFGSGGGAGGQAGVNQRRSRMVAGRRPTEAP